MQLIKYLLIVLVAAVLVSATASWLANKGLQRSSVDFYGKLNEARKPETETNLLLVGSSRILKQMDPHIIDSVCHYNSFDYGLNSGTIKTWYNIIKCALNAKSNAKGVILNVDYNMFDIARDPYKDAYYYPFESSLPQMVLNDSGTANLVHHSRVFDIALYDDYAKYAAIDGWLRPGRITPGVYKGYYPNQQLNYFETIADSGITRKEIVFSKEGMALLDSCISLCKQNNVKLLLVMAPYFKRYSPDKYFTNFNAILDNVKAIAKQSGIPFCDFREMSLANDQQYFYNVNHLNSKGATVYTLAIADSVKKYWQ